MRIAVLADIHGNLPALRAVLAELDRDPVDAIVAAGDQLAGPCARSVLQALTARPEPVAFISGNGEREALAADPEGCAVEGEPDRDAKATAIWAARDLGELIAQLRAWPITLDMDGVCFCHGSPRRDDEVITRLTPETVIAEIVAGTSQPLIVGGHTHQQMIRSLPGGKTYVNAGSVGLPFEGAPGAYWLIVEHGTPEPRMTPYELGAARDELAATGFPGLADFLEGSVCDPLDPGWVSAFFEHVAGRAGPPGEPTPSEWRTRLMLRR